MPRTNKTLTNFVGGELSPLLAGRVDLPIFQKGLARCENFIALAQGGAKFRPGTTFVKHTRRNQFAVLVPFQFSDQQAYLIEATEKKFRFYKDNGIILETAKTITNISNANPLVITTSAAHGFSAGDEIYISGVKGMTQLNGKYFIVGAVTATTITLYDVYGHLGTPTGLGLLLTNTQVNSTAYGSYDSGGTVARVYEIDTPFYEIDLPYLQFAQNADTMYITEARYAPRKLTRSAHTTWTLSIQARAGNPASLAPLVRNITGVTKANPGVVASAGHTFTDGQEIYIEAVTGMAELNNRFYTVVFIDANTFSLKTSPEGVAVDTTLYTAYAANGTATLTDEYPRAVAFTDSGRLVYGGTLANPETMWFSKAPSSGTIAFDDFTNGTGATDGITATLAPIHGKVDSIQWLAFTSKFLVAGTYGSIRRIYGGTEQEPVSPSSFTAKSVNSFGCALSLPVSNGESLFYVQRGNFITRSLEYDLAIDGYVTTDRHLVADHLTKSGIKQLVEQQGTPDVIWNLRNDGRYIGLTFKEKEDISGWHRHYNGGSHLNTQRVNQEFAKVLWQARMPRPTNVDQLWFVSERYINGQVVRTVEYMNDWVKYSIESDFYTASTAEAKVSDRAKWLNALYEDQKDAIFLDCSLTYDGTAYGTNANASLIPGAGATTVNVTGQPIGLLLSLTYPEVTFYASAPVFESNMVGRELRKQYDINGDGGGRARITSFVTSSEVRVQLLSAFDSTEAIAPGRWFITASTISGLEHLEGETVGVIQDGGPGSDATVSGGAITLDAQYSKVHVGFKYRGVIELLNLDTGGVTGSAQAKTRNLIAAAFRFKDTLGAKFGTDPYALEQLSFRSTANMLSRPTPLFTGIKRQSYRDRYEDDEKRLLIVQELPLPCTLLSVDCFLDTSDE